MGKIVKFAEKTILNELNVEDPEKIDQLLVFQIIMIGKKGKYFSGACK